jgi:hypothetical protein
MKPWSSSFTASRNPLWDTNTEEESTISISEQEEFLLLENIFVFAVTFMVYGGHRHFEQYSSHYC